MNAYANDARVQKVGRDLYLVNVVHSGEHNMTVYVDHSGWWAADRGLEDYRQGPFGSADDAIKSLIGDPR